MSVMCNDDIEQNVKLLEQIIDALKRGEGTGFEMRRYISESRIINDISFDVKVARNMHVYIKTTD